MVNFLIAIMNYCVMGRCARIVFCSFDVFIGFFTKLVCSNDVKGPFDS